ncbi:jg23477 [Pararge aegeria aegeria]|uniref:Jg23477 protein n=1 Tax=Pararge aegeria aegeria TaxID=348720 RepID=A0A8S4RYE5_9NEOP|nr:jg23477 [Pararge aegeria aegeria]
MKGVSFFFILLFLEAHGSFLDDFRSAISNINNGFGKLIGDVVTDVKDTIYCTISAVEQVLVQNGLLDKRTLYNQRCNQMDMKKVPTTDEADRLSEIRKILQQESENISENVKNEIKKLHLDSKTPVESIWEEIQLLNDLRRNSKNETEVKEISRILDKVTDGMHSKIDSQKILDTHKLEELKKVVFQKKTDNNGKLNSSTEKQELSKKSKDSIDVEKLKKNNIKDEVNHKRDGNTQKEHNQSQEKSIFSLGLESLGSFFNSISASPDDVENAKKLITDSQHSDKSRGGRAGQLIFDRERGRGRAEGGKAGEASRGKARQGKCGRGRGGVRRVSTPVGTAPRPGCLLPPRPLRNDARARELMAALVWWLAACCLVRAVAAGNPDAKRLYDDLLSNYNKLVRPVVNTTDVLRVCIKLKLSQLIDVINPQILKLLRIEPTALNSVSRVAAYCAICRIDKDKVEFTIDLLDRITIIIKDWGSAESTFIVDTNDDVNFRYPRESDLNTLANIS